MKRIALYALLGALFAAGLTFLYEKPVLDKMRILQKAMDIENRNPPTPDETETPEKDKIYYWVPDNPNGDAVVVSLGFAGGETGVASFYPIVNPLLEMGYIVITGYVSPKEIQVETLYSCRHAAARARTVNAMLDKASELGARQVILFTVSAAGGPDALEALKKGSPVPVKSIILYGSVGDLPNTFTAYTTGYLKTNGQWNRYMSDQRRYLLLRSLIEDLPEKADRDLLLANLNSDYFYRFTENDSPSLETAIKDRELVKERLVSRTAKALYWIYFEASPEDAYAMFERRDPVLYDTYSCMDLERPDYIGILRGIRATALYAADDRILPTDNAEALARKLKEYGVDIEPVVIPEILSHSGILYTRDLPNSTKIDIALGIRTLIRRALLD